MGLGVADGVIVMKYYSTPKGWGSFFFGFKVLVAIRFTKLLSKPLYCALRRALRSHDLSQKKTLCNHGWRDGNCPKRRHPCPPPSPWRRTSRTYAWQSTILRGSSLTIWRGKKVSEQEFWRPHHNHLTSINAEIDHCDNGSVLIARRISNIKWTKIR